MITGILICLGLLFIALSMKFILKIKIFDNILMLGIIWITSWVILILSLIVISDNINFVKKYNKIKNENNQESFEKIKEEYIFLREEWWNSGIIYIIPSLEK